MRSPRSPRTRPLLLPLLALSILPGCATKEFVQQEVGAVHRRIDDLSAQLAKAGQRIDEHGGRIEAAVARIVNTEQAAAHLDRRVGETQQALTAAGQRMDELHTRLHTAEQHISRQDGEIARIHTRLDSLGDGLGHAAQNVERAIARLDQAEASIASLQAVLKEKTQTSPLVPPTPAATPTATVSGSQPLDFTGEAHQRLEEIASRIAAAHQRIDEQAAVLTSATQRLTAVEASLKTSQSQLDGVNAGLNATRLQLEAAQARLAGAENRIAANADAISNAQRRLEGVAQGLTASESRVAEVNDSLRLARERIDTLQTAMETQDERLRVNERSIHATNATLSEMRAELQTQTERISRHESELAQLSATAREALERALAAGKLAEGKLVYETALSEALLGYRPYKTSLSPEARQTLKDLANKLLAENRNIYIEIQGHTDTSGTPALNRRLGQARAEAVRDFLHTAGIPLHRMSVISYGDSRPLADNRSREGRAKNRRVVLVVLK